ncbi:MAG: cellulase family glycosylhydrolase [Phaeodactylibacter sp.]|nr:cellulase family glycosylhydrolase [Phaeodactylibacter sp.]MCB9304262.1 cellulase family glycosylhydrolase [Lewinellaceae bacterium]
MPKFFLFAGLLFLARPTDMNAQEFVTVQGAQFIRNGAPYHFLGTNLWYGINLASQGPGGDRERLIRELDRLQALQVDNLRIMAASEGPDEAPWRMSPALQPAEGSYNDTLWDALDFLLAEMGKRDMVAVVCLGNFWPWSGGMAQYVSWQEGSLIPYPPPADGGDWLKYMLYSARFYKNEPAKAAYWAHLEKLITRTNTYTGLPYRDDPTIMAWQLANEPRGMLSARAYRKWIKESATRIKELDPNHLVCIGSEGNTPAPTGNHFRKDHHFGLIDYTTIHIWVQNWQWYDPHRPEETFEKALQKATHYVDKHLRKAEKLNKPMVLEEFGMARDDDNHSDTASVAWRDRYYTAIFGLVHRLAQEGSPMAGCNFWAWGGEGRPREPHSIWKSGDAFIGDPPHEFQGWYSVYDKDASTLEVIKAYAENIKAVGNTIP